MEEVEVLDGKRSGIAANPRTVGFVDLDGTLAKHDREYPRLTQERTWILRRARFRETTTRGEGYIMPAFIEYLAGEKIVEEEHFERMKEIENDMYNGKISYLTGASLIYDAYLAALHGKMASDIKRHAREFARQVDVYPHTKELLQTLDRSGVEIYSLTANPAELMSGIAEHWSEEWGVKINPGITSRLRTDKEGRLRGDFSQRALSGLEKRWLLSVFANKTGTDLLWSTCFGDSEFSDGPSLALVGKGYLVDTNGNRQDVWGFDRYKKEALKLYIEELKSRSEELHSYPEEMQRKIRKRNIKSFARSFADVIDLAAILHMAAEAPAYDETTRRELRTAAQDVADAVLKRGDHSKKGLRERIEHSAARFHDSLKGAAPEIYMKEVRAGTRGITLRGEPISYIVGRLYPFPFPSRKARIDAWVNMALNNYRRNRCTAMEV